MSTAALCLWLLAAAGCGLVFILAPGAWTLALVAAVVCVPLAAIAAAAAERNSVAVDILPPRAAGKGDAAVITVQGSSDGLLPLPRVVFRFTVCNCLTGQLQHCRVRLSVPAGGRGEASVTLRSEYCGLFRIRAQRLQVCDPFGICGFSTPDERCWDFAVQPGLFDMSLLLPMRTGSCDDSDRYAPDRPGFDFADTFQVREYAPGDSPRQIHWKLSSKLDRMIVRDPGLPLERAVTILWERGGAPAPRESDAMAEVLSTLCRELLRQGVGCRVSWNGEDGLSSCETRDPEGFYELLPQLLSAAPVQTGGTVTEQYLRLYGAERDAKVIYMGIADDPQLSEICPAEHLVSILFRPGEGQGTVYAFDSDSYEKALSELVLY